MSQCMYKGSRILGAVRKPGAPTILLNIGTDVVDAEGVRAFPETELEGIQVALKLDDPCEYTGGKVWWKGIKLRTLGPDVYVG